mmetsp:Transcript_26926/g.27309  ORF Transcript_26926/g.27309 Transcript_26926/m.27309 type:complete len:81 (+) Transcript_26926:311-553(+)
MKRRLPASTSQHFLNHQQWVRGDSNKGQNDIPTNDDNDTDRYKTKLSQEAAAKKKKQCSIQQLELQENLLKSSTRSELQS